MTGILVSLAVWTVLWMGVVAVCVGVMYGGTR